MRLLVAGGAGFIGSNYVGHHLEANPDDAVRVLDKLTYAGRRENLERLPEDRWELVEADIADRDAVGAAIEGCDAVGQLRRRVPRRPLDRGARASSS